MGKPKINEKIITEHKLNIEGTLNIDKLEKGVIFVEIEDEGEMDIKKYLDRFNGQYIKMILSDKTEQIPE